MLEALRFTDLGAGVTGVVERDFVPFTSGLALVEATRLVDENPRVPCFMDELRAVFGGIISSESKELLVRSGGGGGGGGGQNSWSCAGAMMMGMTQIGRAHV